MFDNYWALASWMKPCDGNYQKPEQKRAERNTPMKFSVTSCIGPRTIKTHGGKEKEMHHSSSLCRSCEQPGLEMILDLGRTPLSDRLLTKEQLKQPEPAFPLEVAFCPTCGLVQILETVSPELLFCDGYLYYSSFSPALLEHSRENVLDLIKSRNLDAKSFVVELASNDGYLLKNYVDKGIPSLGIDPAGGQARAAEEIGVPTLCTFFTKELAQKLRGDGPGADVIHANNVLAHVPDTNGFVEGIGILLKDDGVAVIEVPYVKELVDHCEFDTMWTTANSIRSTTSIFAIFR
jgi:hypothetical protein